MADVQPLRGLRYAHDKVQDLSSVVTPPYDIINAEAQERYYQRDPYNIIRLELGQQTPHDDELNNVYTRAAALLSEWRTQGILHMEEQACYYLYQQVFSAGGQNYTRTSLLARVRLEPWSARVVLPHEHTLKKAREDRLNLYRACAANLSPIMSLFEDPQGRMRRLLASYAEQPEISFSDEDGVERRLQPVRNSEHIALIQDFFRERQLYIADGHHRYETALAYRAELEEQRKTLHPEDAANFTLMSLIDVDDPGMLVMPTHRLLFNLGPDALQKLKETELARFFDVEHLEALADEDILPHLEKAGRERTAFILKTAQDTLLLRLKAQGQTHMESSEHTDAWKRLDVAIAQRLILEETLGLRPEDMTAGTHVRYSHDAQHVFSALVNGEIQAALLLNSTPLRQVCEVAQADDRMPQKSTYIYPKLITGLVMNPLW
ncbi:DUF1015 domain-containing protein [Ktedonospora formicarum]|uniref:Phosphatase n=1 Tax=Ktedonospora formicarum TaxID=2778364 RepID=A0A8J3HWD8_9CHLR|nr:DUF1015 domain-containing protein [Ktedonospora formicarum]GHO45317.1 phosphatase [Ktedonospora formicarum]